VTRSSDLCAGPRKKFRSTLLLALITSSRNTSAERKGGRARRSAASLVQRAEGQALVEYSLILGLVVVGLITAYQSLGTTVSRLFTGVTSAFGG
jgi:Flp pilus assembly pilin Flp